MSSWRIYHNPRCSKSRKTLELLRENSIEPQVIEYLKQPPSREELEKILDALGLGPETLIRTKEDAFAPLNVDLSDRASVLSAIADHPELLERPVVIHEGRAVLGRPPENVLKLLSCA